MAKLQKNESKVRRFQRLLKVANWIASIPTRVTPAPFRVLQLESALWQSRAIFVATRLEVADAIADGRKTSRELAAALNLHEDSLYRLLRMLASIGIFREIEPRLFVNSKMSHCLRRDHPQSVRAMVLMHNAPVMVRPWVDELEEGIRSGETPFVRTHGVALFDYMDQDKAFDLLFSEAMDAVEALTSDDYLQDFDWSGFDRLIDVGGSKGAKAVAILARQTHMRALVFDRPQAIENAASAWKGKVDDAVLGRMEYAGGDMFSAIPACTSDRDVYLFMAMFHGLSDDEAKIVLANLRRALGTRHPGIVVVDMVADECNIDPSVASFDMQMLVNTRGRERTLAEWGALFQNNGFAIAELVMVRTFASFIVLKPI